MQVSVESIGTLARRMQVRVPAEKVTEEIAARLKSLSRTARLNGFRPGKAPMKVIVRQFGPQVRREVIGELLQSSFVEAVSQQRLAPAGNPRIEPQNLDEGQDLRYVATFEVFPDIDLKPAEELQIERATAEVTEADVDAMLERLRKQQTRYQAASRAAALGDRITVDFEGKIDGEDFAGGKAENVSFVLGDGKMLPEFEARLPGTAAGEKRAIELDFPADYRATELAGKHAVFEVRVASVEQAMLPEVDDEFCKVFGVAEGGIAKLREEVAGNMRRELEQTLRSRAKAAALDKLLQANPVEVPSALVETQVRDMQVEAMRRAGITDPAQAPSPQPFLEPARRRAALGLILAEIIKREQLCADAQRVEQRLDEMVGIYGDPEALKRAYRQNAEAMRRVEGLVLEDQAVDWILAHAKVSETASSFKELMNFGA
ncbi:MAG TPA: trigger factor [Steroidobacteraceae bacterium]|nr:trigger factor [Steroidobacteraceae bacterium]